MMAEELEPFAMASVKSAPIPLSAMICGLVPLLLTMVSVPERNPLAAGVKVTVTLQPPPGASDPGHLLVKLKSALAATLVIVRALVPVLLMTTVCGALARVTVVVGKVNAAGARPRLG